MSPTLLLTTDAALAAGIAALAAGWIVVRFLRFLRGAGGAGGCGCSGAASCGPADGTIVKTPQRARSSGTESSDPVNREASRPAR